MKLVVFFTLFFNISAKAIDYKLCTDYINFQDSNGKRRGVGAFVTMSEKGVIEQSADAKTFDKKNGFLTASFERVYERNKKSVTSSTLLVKKDNNKIVITVFSNETIKQNLGTPGSFGFEKKLMEAYKTPSRKDEQLLYEDAAKSHDGKASVLDSKGQSLYQVFLKIENGKCYPETVKSTDGSRVKMDPDDGLSASIMRTVDAKKCRLIKEFFKYNPNIISEGTALKLARLKELLVGTPGVSRIKDEQLTRGEKNKKTVQKLINMAKDELKFCKSYRLAPAVDDESLWQGLPSGSQPGTPTKPE